MQERVAGNPFAQHIRNDMPPIATFRFDLPDEQSEFDAARLGRAALSALWQIDQHCRSLCKHGEPTPAARRLAEEIRRMIPPELLET
jgi:hypothetical protein